MKGVAALILLLTAGYISFAQKTEYSLHIGSGFFSYQGTGSVDKTNTYYTPYNSAGQEAGSPYGREHKFAFTGMVQVQRVFKNHFLAGSQLGFESLVAEAVVDSSFFSALLYHADKVNAIERFRNNYINLSPFTGYRIVAGSCKIDLTAGIDLGVLLGNRLTLHVMDTVRHTEYPELVATYHNRIFMDCRIHAAITACYKNIGLSFGYSRGLSDYNKDASAPVYTSFLRYAIVYTFQ